jgi:hypothetical protein
MVLAKDRKRSKQLTKKTLMIEKGQARRQQDHVGSLLLPGA